VETAFGLGLLGTAISTSLIALALAPVSVVQRLTPVRGAICT
jgi:hypothetical protein